MVYPMIKKGFQRFQPRWFIAFPSRWNISVRRISGSSSLRPRKKIQFPGIQWVDATRESWFPFFFNVGEVVIGGLQALVWCVFVLMNVRSWAAIEDREYTILQQGFQRCSCWVWMQRDIFFVKWTSSERTESERGFCWTWATVWNG